LVKNKGNKDLSSLSVNDSSMQIITRGDKKSIKKVTRINKEFRENISLIFQYTLNYIKSLQMADISLPEIYESRHTDDELIFECEYVGENILNYLEPENFEDTIKEQKIFPYILQCLKNAQISNINFDPHPKNYVLKDGLLNYVDFTPPWHEDYYSLRKGISNSPKDKKILEEFFECFNPENIGYHLAGDLLKLNLELESKLELLYKELLKKNIVSGTYTAFLDKAKEIKRRETLREELDIYLL
jgi:hypothetical protein